MLLCALFAPSANEFDPLMFKLLQTHVFFVSVYLTLLFHDYKVLQHGKGKNIQHIAGDDFFPEKHIAWKKKKTGWSFLSHRR